MKRRSQAADLAMPPDDLTNRSPLYKTIYPGTHIYRIYKTKRDGKRRNPTYYGTSQGDRFNAPDGTYGVMYLSAQREGAFVETLLRNPGATLIDEKDAKTRGLAVYATKRKMQLISLFGAGLARLGATADLCHRALPYDYPQGWSKTLHDSFTDADGIAYRARHNDDILSYALFERAAAKIELLRCAKDLTKQIWFWQLMETYRLGLVPAPTKRN